MLVASNSYATALRTITAGVLQNAYGEPLTDDVSGAGGRVRTAKEIEEAAFSAQLRLEWANDTYMRRLSAALNRAVQIAPVRTADDIYPFYADAVRAMEKRVEAAVTAYWHSAVAALVAARILADHRRQLLYRQPQTSKAARALVVPPPGTLEGWGSTLAKERKSSKDEAPVLSGDSERDVQALLAAMAQDLAQIVGLAPGKATAPRPGETPLHALMEQLAGAAATAADALDTLVRSEYGTLMTALRAQSLYEYNQLVPQYSEQLLTIWSTMVEFYRDALARVTSVAELRDELTREAVVRLERSSDVLEQYRAAAPLMPPSVVGAPRKRNLEAIMARGGGAELAKWYRALTPLISTAEAAKLFTQRPPFVKEIPTVLVEEERAPIEAGDAMDRVHGAIVRLARDDVAPILRALYEELRTRTAPVLPSAAAAQAPRAKRKPAAATATTSLLSTAEATQSTLTEAAEAAAAAPLSPPPLPGQGISLMSVDTPATTSTMQH